MKYTLPDGQVIHLKPMTDAEYDRAQGLILRSLDICPTCGGKDEPIEGAGMKQWKSEGYWLDGQHHQCNCLAQIALFTRYLLANIGTQYMRLDWAEFAGVKVAKDWVLDYVANWQSFLAHGFGLTFASKSQGVGKTWAATHIGKELVKQRQRVCFLDFVEMVDAFCNDDAVVAQRMRDTTFVILDDVRAGISERQNDLYALKFEVVIRHRTNFDLPTLLTTNLTEREFETEFPRIYSLIAPKQKWVEMNGVDYRKLSSTGEQTAAMIARGEVRPIT